MIRFQKKAVVSKAFGHYHEKIISKWQEKKQSDKTRRQKKKKEYMEKGNRAGSINRFSQSNWFLQRLKTGLNDCQRHSPKVENLLS